MKKLLFLIACILVISVLSSSALLAAAPDNNYQMLFSDEFEGTELDTNTWIYRAAGTTSTAKNLDENIRVANGKMYIDYRKVDGLYTGGGIITRNLFPYGYYETKALTFTGASGLHTSFWTSTANNPGSPYFPQRNHLIEVDGFEFNSRQDGIAPKPAYALHYWWGGRDTQGGKTYSSDADGDETTNDEFVMGFEILPGKIIYYSNGVEVGRFNTTIYSSENIWLTALAMPDKYLQADGTFSIDETNMDENGYFGSSEYDYVRYYQKKLKGVNLLANGHFEFNRVDSVSAAPRSFYKSGVVNISKTPFAHSGFCAATLSGNSTMGKNLMHLLGGAYTFEGYFKSQEGTVARMVVYDNSGAELTYLPITVTREWTKFSIPDIAVTDSAYVVVEVTKGLLMADDLNFFSQDGEEGYEEYRDTDYEKYTAIATSESSAIQFLASEATSVGDVKWSHSTAGEINNEANYYGTVKTSTYKNVSASWTKTMEQSGIFDLKVFRILWDNNIPKQYYTVTVDGTTVLDSIETVTKNGSAQSGEWLSLGTLEVEEGQTVTITVTPGAPERTISDILNGRASSALMRICPLQMIPHDELLVDTSLIMQVNNPIYQYKSTPYAFDPNDPQLFPYLSTDALYIPYQAIKSIMPIAGVADDTTYVTLEQLEGTGRYKVLQTGSYIILYDKQYTASENFEKSAIKTFSQFKDHVLIPEEIPTYVGTADAPYQQVHTHAEAQLFGNWGSSTLGYNKSSKYTNNAYATVDWKFSPTSSGRYMVQIYNIAHQGGGSAGPSTTAASVKLSVDGKLHTYTLDQYEGETGWYNLTTANLTPDNLIHIHMYNAAGANHLRACAVRLVPVFDEATFYSAYDGVQQTVIDHQNATATENWTASEDVKEFYSSENVNATVTYQATPAKSGNYRVQIYQPQGNANATTAVSINVVANDDSASFLLNQTATQEGWYDLGTFTLSPTNPAIVSIMNFAGKGVLYSKSVRLIPEFTQPAFVTEKDAINQEIYDHNQAAKVGSWQNSTGVYDGCCTTPPREDNQHASITWTVNPKTEDRYSVQVYVPKQTASGARDATALLNINGNLAHYTLYQRADSEENTGTGWYDLGIFDLKTTDSVSVELTNRTYDGWLRAKAIRLVPVAEDATFATTESYLHEICYGTKDAETTGNWVAEGEFLRSADKDASVSWTILSETEEKSDIQVYLPENASSDIQIYFEFNGKYKNFVPKVQGEGWYSLGKLDLNVQDELIITLTNAGEGVLYAKAVRLLPVAPKAVMIANFDEPNQELWGYDKAVKTGNWKASGGDILGGSYYGADSETAKATATWTVTPKKAQKYSVQFFVPCYTVASTTAHGYATLNIDGKETTVSFTEYADPAVHTGWYDFGVFDLSPDSTVTITMGKTAESYLRVKAVRLIPYPGQATVTKDGTTVTAKLGTLSRYQDNFLFAEFDASGILQSVKQFDTAPTVNLNLTDANNNFKLFFWGDNLAPVTSKAE